jgi:hypothetical protein
VSPAGCHAGWLLKSVTRQIADRRALHPIKIWPERPMEETDDRGRKTRTTGTAVDARGSMPCYRLRAAACRSRVERLMFRHGLRSAAECARPIVATTCRSCRTCSIATSPPQLLTASLNLIMRLDYLPLNGAQIVICKPQSRGRQ